MIITDTNNHTYSLGRDFRETCHTPYAVSKAQVRKIFNRKGTFVDVLGKILDSEREFSYTKWAACYSEGDLKIGCRYFNEKETKRIRRWAFRKAK